MRGKEVFPSSHRHFFFTSFSAPLHSILLCVCSLYLLTCDSTLIPFYVFCVVCCIVHTCVSLFILPTSCPLPILILPCILYLLYLCDSFFFYLLCLPLYCAILPFVLLWRRILCVWSLAVCVCCPLPVHAIGLHADNIPSLPFL